MSSTTNPAGTVTLLTAPDNLYEAPQVAGVQHVTKDSELTLASYTVTGTAEAGFFAGSLATKITAAAGGGQSKATQLTAAVNIISTCATAADSVALPDLTFTAGYSQSVFVRNDGAKNAQVFAVDPGTINGVATATGVSLTAASSATYRLIAADTWVT